MRLVVAAVAGFALAVVPALAADHSVTTEGNSFKPATITIAPGDQVIWTGGANHTVHFEGEASGTSLATQYERTFDTAGTYEYFCDPHKDQGMAGRVVVKAPDTTGTTGTTTQTTTTTTTTTTTSETTPTPPPPPAVSVRAMRTSFCVRRNRRCRRPGVVLRITSDTPHRVEGRLLRPNGLFGKLAFDVPAGTKTVRFTRTREGRRLTRGRYSVKLGSAPVVRFRVR